MKQSASEVVSRLLGEELPPSEETAGGSPPEQAERRPIHVYFEGERSDDISAIVMATSDEEAIKKLADKHGLAVAEVQGKFYSGTVVYDPEVVDQQSLQSTIDGSLGGTKGLWYPNTDEEVIE